MPQHRSRQLLQGFIRLAQLRLLSQLEGDSSGGPERKASFDAQPDEVDRDQDATPHANQQRDVA